jgi:hypothetical protein
VRAKAVTRRARLTFIRNDSLASFDGRRDLNGPAGQLGYF